MNAPFFATLHVTSSTGSRERFSSSGERALVLGGGGSAGNAWLIGLIAGLCDAGLNVTDVDLVVGTSAGSTAAAQIGGTTPPTELFANILAATPPARPVGSAAGRAPLGPVADHMERTGRIIAAAQDPADMRRRMGAAALALPADSGWQARWRATVAGRLTTQDWPGRSMLVTAVDARTGDPVVFDRHSGVDLADAVAASCTNGFGVPPYVIGDTAYLDGGYRRNENADLATGFARVLVLSPFSGRTRHPLQWGMQLEAQVGELRAGGARVETVFPDDNPGDMFGSNAMDPLTRPVAARLGLDQGHALAGRLSEFWR